MTVLLPGWTVARVYRVLWPHRFGACAAPLPGSALSATRHFSVPMPDECGLFRTRHQQAAPEPQTDLVQRRAPSASC